MHVDVTAGTLAGRSRYVPWTEEIGNSLIVREPFGVAGAITPWNFPLQEMILKVAPAIKAGNAIVLKPSQLAPLIAGILAEVGAEAGVPAGLLDIVHGLGSVVETRRLPSRRRRHRIHRNYASGTRCRGGRGRNAPRMLTALAEAHRRGAKIVHINPLLEAAAPGTIIPREVAAAGTSNSRRR
jgi:hypothetical protein